MFLLRMIEDWTVKNIPRSDVTAILTSAVNAAVRRDGARQCGFITGRCVEADQTDADDGPRQPDRTASAARSRQEPERVAEKCAAQRISGQQGSTGIGGPAL